MKVRIALILFSAFFFGLPVISYAVLGGAPECSDGIDNDGDIRRDYPADPQCFGPEDTDEWHPSQCSDGVDNDGDGDVDRADQGCFIGSAFPIATERCERVPPEFRPECIQGILVTWPFFDNSERPECSDGIDNDGDGRRDPQDPSCSSPDDHNEGNPPQCSDGIDNDGDGKVDYPSFWGGNWGGDKGCTSENDDNEVDNPQCSDHKDNDEDGRRDYPADQGCVDAEDNSETNIHECSDGRDNDYDGYIDFPFDDSCRGPTSGGEVVPSQCLDGIDNDGDGFIDYPNDAGCTHPFFDRDERNQCSDGFDNDDDGQIDYPIDRSCSDANDNDELEPRQCKNGLDDDGDGRSDLADLGCANEYDNDEYNTYQCNDTIDNDGDGGKDYRPSWLDFSGDSDCDSPFDDDEVAENSDAMLAGFTFRVEDITASLINLFKSVFALGEANTTPTVTLSVGAGNANAVEIPNPDAYKTFLNIEWKVGDEPACSCAGHISGTTDGDDLWEKEEDWWALGGGSLLNGAGGGNIVVNIIDPPQVSYTLTCYGVKGISCKTDVEDGVEDTVTATPIWNPLRSTPVDLTGPSKATKDDIVTLNYKLYDIKSCTATTPNVLWWGKTQNDEIKTGNIQPREGGGSVPVGLITRNTIFTLSCTGFDNKTHTDDVKVNLVEDIPFYSVTTTGSQTIIVTLGASANPSSSKAEIEVYAGGGFSSEVGLSASGVPQGFVSRFSPSSISCSGGASRCGTADFWVEGMGGEQTEGLYPITISATSGAETKTTTVNLRVRRFTPAFQEI